MDQGWLPQGPDKLASDPDLRAVQIQWLWDTLLMRRITFALSVASVPTNLLISLWAPRVALATAAASAGAGLVSLAVQGGRKGTRKATMVEDVTEASNQPVHVP